MLVWIEKIFAKQTKQDGDKLVDIIYCLSIIVIEGDEDLLDGRRAAQGLLSDSSGLNEAVNEVPGEPKDRLRHLIGVSTRPADCSSHLERVN